MSRILPASKVFSDQLALLGVQPSTPLAVAFSGGPDSTALLLLTSSWSNCERRPAGLTNQNTQGSKSTPTALVVDHCLRPESAAEAEQALEAASSLGLNPVLLKAEWPHGRPTQGQLMPWAREERYRLMTGACASLGIPCLLTGHHADDQAETFLMRIARSSGIDGLQGMRREVSFVVGGMHGRILRPLLSLHKADLVEVCRSAGLPWAEDPTNANTAYARNKMRAVLWQSDEKVEAVQRFRSVSPGRTEAAATSGNPEQADQRSSEAEKGGSVSAVALPSNGAESLGGMRSTAERVKIEQKRESSITKDLLRLVDACSDASAILTNRSNALRKAAVPDAAEDWSECSVDTATLMGSSRPVAVRALAAMLQDVSCSAQAPAREAHALWRRLLPGRQPKAFCTGGTIECHVPGGRWPVINVSLRKGQGRHADVHHSTLRFWRASKCHDPMALC